MLVELTKKAAEGSELNAAEIERAAEALLAEKASSEEKADFLRALHRKGESPAEVADFVRAFLRYSVRPNLPAQETLDLCGTGGDRLGLFNISTASMFVAASCGVPIVKHGNRGITSKCGGADVLEALGVRIDLPPEQAGDALAAAGCLFLFAPLYHPAFRRLGPVRQALAAEGSPSILNILGPLLNPAHPSFQMAGVFDPRLLSVYADVFRRLGRKHAWVVHGSVGATGMDELSTLGPSQILAVEGGRMKACQIEPSQFAFAPASVQDLQGTDAKGNADFIEEILRGRRAGPARDIVALNAGAAITVAGAAPDLAAGVGLASQALSDGAPGETLERLRRVR